MSSNKTSESSQKHHSEAKKESYYKMLSSVLGGAGIQVRREKLKQGPGWRVASGQCRSADRKMVFVDSRMILDEQIAFLAGQVARAKIELGADVAEKLPEAIRNQCSMLPAA